MTHDPSKWLNIQREEGKARRKAQREAAAQRVEARAQRVKKVWGL